MTVTLRARVSAALANAVDNGCTCSSELEDEDPVDLEPHVAEWRRNR